MNIHCIENFFTVHDLSNLHLPGNNRVALKIFTILNSGFLTTCKKIFFNNLRLPWKQSLPWNFSLYWIYFLPFRIWATCACFEKELPRYFTVLNILFTFRIWATCAFPEKQRVSRIHCIEYIFFIIRDLSSLACPENRVCPEIFQAQGGATAPPSRTPKEIILWWIRMWRAILKHETTGKTLRKTRKSNNLLKSKTQARWGPGFYIWFARGRGGSHSCPP